MALFIAFLAIVSCSAQDQEDQIDQKISSIETGLFDLTGQSSSNLSLLDEMTNKNVPGTTSFLTGFPNQGKGAAIMTNGINGELIQLELIGAIGRAYDWPESKLF